MSRGLAPVALGCIAAALSGMAMGAEGADLPEPLPEPLTLEHALSLADADHFEILEAVADLDQAEADASAAAAGDDLAVNLLLRLRRVEPSEVSLNRTKQDNAARLLVTKPLYDFGRTAARLRSARASVVGRESLLDYTVRERRVEIMRRYFDVLLADLRYARDNEVMAVAFVRLDRLRDRQDLGEVSDVEVLEAEAEFTRLRRARAVAETRQRATRALLAETLGRPGQLSATLRMPDLSGNERPLPPVGALTAAVVEDSPLTASARAELAAAAEAVEAARAGGRPVLTGEVELAEYERELSSRDQWRVGVVLDIPLYAGAAVDADVAGARARLRKARARVQRLESELRQTVLELWQEIGTLRVAREAAETRQGYEELSLDRSRALYELEVRTDLGDSMASWSDARLERTSAELELALAWARLEALVGDERLAALLPGASAAP